MFNDYIAILDSGIGGMSVLKKFSEKIKNGKFLYFGDNANAPYGNKSKRKLIELTFNNVNYLNSLGVKILVVGCNTISLNVLPYIRNFFNGEVYGVFPPIETPIFNGEKTLLLSTCMTAKKFTEKKNLKIVGLPFLARDIEDNKFCLKKVNFLHHFDTLKEKFQSIVLGCTHYFFIKNQIIDHLKPQKIYFGEDFTVDYIINKHRLPINLDFNSKFQVKFMGQSKIENQKFWLEVVTKEYF